MRGLFVLDPRWARDRQSFVVLQVGRVPRLMVPSLFALLGVLAAPRDAAAACPTPPPVCSGHSVSGSTSVADGSSPIEGTTVCIHALSVFHNGADCQPGGVISWPGFSAGGEVYKVSARGGLAYYFSPPTKEVASCTGPPCECASCSTSSYNFQFYSFFGNVAGTVTNRFTGKPFASARVDLSTLDPETGECHRYLYSYTDSNGEYSFASDSTYLDRSRSKLPDRPIWLESDTEEFKEAFRDNKWSPYVVLEGDGTGPGTYDYYVGQGEICNDKTKVTVTSSKETQRDFYQDGSTGLLTEAHPCDQDPSGGDNPNCILPGGGQQPPAMVGGRVSIVTGNVNFQEVDVAMDLLDFSRTYNSKAAERGDQGILGLGWLTSFDGSVVATTIGKIQLTKPNGGTVYFQDDGNGQFKGNFPKTERTTLQRSGTNVIRSFRGGGSEVYDSGGRITSRSDASGNTISINRDAGGRPTTITSPSGRSFALGYDGSSRLRTVSGPEGVLASYGYDRSGRLETVSYPDNSGYRYDYDAKGRLLQVADFEGIVLETYEYTDGRATSMNTASGGKRAFAYHGSSTTVTDEEGETTTYELTEVAGLPRVTRATGPCESCGGGGGESRSWDYDEAGRVARYTNGAGEIRSYSYNEQGDLETYTDPLLRSTSVSHTYDGDRIATRTVAGFNGTQTTAAFGVAGPTTSTVKVTETSSRSVGFGYRPNGDLETLTDGRGKTTTLGYHATTRDLVSVTNGAGQPVASYSYDGMGRVRVASNGVGKNTSVDYNGAGRVTRLTAHDGTHTDFSYDRGGRLKTVVDPLGRKMTYVYDRKGRLSDVIDPAGGRTVYTYDAKSRLIALTDANGQKTRFEYDVYNRLKKTIYPGTDQLAETLTYDTAGRLKTRTDRKNVVTTYSYDVLGRPTRADYSDGTTPSVVITYNDLQRRMTIANGTDTLIRSYDFAGGLRSEESDLHGSTVSYEYDAAGNRSSLSLDGAVWLSYAYDDAERLTSILRGSDAFSFTYDVASRRQSMTYPNGVVTTYDYDELSRLTQITAALGGMPISNAGYLYDAASNRTRKTLLDTTEEYGYDALSRLVSVNRPDRQWRYQYDHVGNRTGEQVDSAATTYTNNEKNQLLTAVGGGTLRFSGSIDEPGAVSVGGVPAQMQPGNEFVKELDLPGGTSNVAVQAADASGNVRTNNYQVTVPATNAVYTYDFNGNLATKVEDGHTWTYEWNARNELMRVVKDGAEVALFSYDPLGRRAQKVIGGATHDYVYDGLDILRESVAGADAAVFRYVHGPGIDEPLSREEVSGAREYYHADGLGSVTSVTGPAGVVVHRYRYDAWGKIEAGAERADFAFTGREWDQEVGLYYYRARYYDPSVGRFISEDPISFASGETNFFLYVGANPVAYRDPLGLNKMGNSQYCAMLARTIANLKMKLAERLGELHENPRELPEACPGDKANPSLSIRGHRDYLIPMDKARIAALEAEFLAYCSGTPTPTATTPPLPVPKPTAAPTSAPAPAALPDAAYSPIEYLKAATGLTGGALVTYIVISEGSRVAFPPRNLVPVP